MKTELLRGGEALFWAVFAITVGGACRLLLVNFEGIGTTWFTWRYIGLVASIGLIAIPYFFSHPWYRAAAASFAGLGIGLIYGLGINGTSFPASVGPFWDAKALWYYLSQTLNTQSPSHAFYVSVAWVSLTGFLIAAAGAVALFSMGEQQAAEIKKARNHNGTNRYRSSETVFGDAKWGRWLSIKGTVGDDQGIVLGEDYDPRKNPRQFDQRDAKTWGDGGKAGLVTLSPKFQSGHVLVFSSSGGGKTAGIVIPTCLNYTHSLIVIDPEMEILPATEKARTDIGRQVRVIKIGAGLNIIKLLERITDRREQVFAQLARLITEPSKEPTSDVSGFFREEAENVLAGLLNHFVSGKAENPFFEVLKFISFEEEAFKKNLLKLVSNQDEDSLLRITMASYVKMDSRTFTSFQSTVKQALKWAPYQELLNVVASEPEDALDPLGPDTDLYIQICKSDMETYPGLMRLIVGTLAHVIDHKPDGHERIMIVDEAFQLGRLQIFEKIRDTARKNHLHLIQIFQSTGQLEKLYGPTGLETWNDLMAARVYSTTESVKDQENISKMIGEYTADIEGKSKSSSSRGWGIGTPTAGTSQNTSLRNVRLMRPEQLRTLPNDGLIVFFRGFDPIICGKAFSFRRADWQKYTPFKSSKG